MLIKIHTLVLTATLSQTQTDVIDSLSNTCPCKQTERETEKVEFYNLFINLTYPPSLSLSLSSLPPSLSPLQLYSNTSLTWLAPAVLQIFWHIAAVCRKILLSDSKHFYL